MAKQKVVSFTVIRNSFLPMMAADKQTKLGTPALLGISVKPWRRSANLTPCSNAFV